jgi:hypothetical protein
MKGENEGKKKKSVADDKSLCFFVTNIDLYKKKKHIKTLPMSI